MYVKTSREESASTALSSLYRIKMLMFFPIDVMIRQYQGCGKGHQSGGPSGGGKRWEVLRATKLKAQGAKRDGKALSGVIAYINGYSGGVSNIALIESVQKSGGIIR